MLCTPYGEFKKNMMGFQAGQSGLPVRIAVNAGESDGAPIRDWSGCYKDRFMRILTVDELPYDDLSEKLFSKEAVVDVTAYAPMWLQHVYNGRFLDLTDFYQNDQLTTDDTRDGLGGDFFRNYLDYAAWVDIDANRSGRADGSRLMALPGTHTGATLMFYRKDLFDRIGAKPPVTWDEYNLLVKELNRPQEQMNGTMICGRHNGQPPVTDWYARLASQGGRQLIGEPAQRNLRSNACSEEGIRAYRLIQEIFAYMPEDVMEYTTADCLHAMAQGHSAVQIGITSFAFPQQYFSKDSPMANRIAAAPIPGENGYGGVGYGGGWSWAIPAGAAEPELSWRTIQFFSSREFDSYRCMQYGTTPVRRSTTQNPDVIKKQPWVVQAGTVMDKAVAPEYFNIPETSAVMKVIDTELTTGLKARAPAEEVLKKVDAGVDSILRDAGWQK